MNDQQLSLPLSVEDQAFVHLEAETGRRGHTGARGDLRPLRAVRPSLLCLLREADDD